MESQNIKSNKAKNIIEGLSKAIDSHLVKGRTYHSDITKNENGSTGGKIYFFENEVLYNYANTGDYTREELDQHTKLISETTFEGFNLEDLITFFPVNSKIRFTLKKGILIKVEAFDVTMLINEIKTKWEKRFLNSDKTHIKTEALIHFKKEADELGLFIDYSEHYSNLIHSFGNIKRGGDNIPAIYHSLDGKIESLYLKYENGKLEAQSNPAFEQFDLSLLSIEKIDLEPKFKEKKDKFEQAKKIRHEFFNSIGKLDERILFLRVGGFRDQSWPENSSSHNSCKMRVIHAKNSTILTTDGLTDIYMRQNLNYNGIGIEFYIEFHEKIPFEVIHKHFAMALVNSVSQIAIAHGNFQKLMLDNETTTIEFKEENVELWVNRENNANNNLFSFIVKENFMSNKNFAVLLGMESKTVPQKVKLNMEEVLMVNIKPVEKKLFSFSKLNNKDNSVAKEARNKIIKSWKDTDEWNLVPLTYQKTYPKDIPNTEGTITAPLFPF